MDRRNICICGNCEQTLTEGQMVCPVCRTQFVLPDIDVESLLKIQMALLDADIRYSGKSLEEAMEEKRYDIGYITIYQKKQTLFV